MGLRAALCAAVCAAMTMVMGAGVATANPPDVAPPEGDDFVAEVPAEFSCTDFGVTVSPVQGKTHAIYFADGRAFFHTPGAKYEVAAANESGRSVVVNGTGAFHDSPPELLDPPIEYGGVTYELAIPTKMTGHNLLFGPFIGTDGEATVGVFAVRGKATVTLLLDFDSGIFAFADLRGGTTTDLCATLRS
jgi:hypothetical protein